MGLTWVALVQPPACVVSPPPLAPASGVGADTTGCHIGTAELGVDVAGPSLPVYPCVATMISFFQSTLLSPSNSGTVGVSPLWRRVQSHFGLLLLTGSCPENPGQAPKARFLWRPRWCHVVASSGCPSRRGRAFTGCLGGFSSARRPSLDTSLSRSVVFWTASVEPVPLERSTAFLTAKSSTTVGQVLRGSSNPLSSL